MFFVLVLITAYCIVKVGYSLFLHTERVGLIVTYFPFIPEVHGLNLCQGFSYSDTFPVCFCGVIPARL
jgi:hypothetical protein